MVFLVSAICTYTYITSCTAPNSPHQDLMLAKDSRKSIKPQRTVPAFGEKISRRRGQPDATRDILARRDTLEVSREIFLPIRHSFPCRETLDASCLGSLTTSPSGVPERADSLAVLFRRVHGR